jgi:hypothetical protein
MENGGNAGDEGKLIADFNAVIADSEELVKAMASAGAKRRSVLFAAAPSRSASLPG